ncbi:disease resistance protein RPS2-like [Dioscorea cayenensis subsp. rotundata]|uniref:Disease resistance protein RPS2-like n=1 Tax=Dioscorea cayennensis subsp. rotundata TaxID=55577 RepID=A0AB40BVK0_DIOCR|nr:disease resistance protein RPS2-like [Dioscorea cayenensis subsp. rotundata]
MHSVVHMGLIDLVSPVASAVAPYLVDPVARQFKYLFLLSNNVNAMTDAMDELRAKRESTIQDIRNAELEGKACSPEVALWLQKVDTGELEVAAIKQAFDQRTNCIAMPSLNVVSNYKLGRRAFKKMEDVLQLLHTEKFDIVAKRLPPGPARELATPSMVSDVNPNLEMICQYLKENTTGIIAIWGMGGVGKTTLLKSINNEFFRAKDGMFDHVIWAVVSQDYSYEKIQSDIATSLGLPSTNANANAIHDFLKRKSFLLLLDDLWSELDLEKIGVPQPKMHHDEDKHKRMVVFTTRSEAICGVMEADKKIKMECLDLAAAWLLFKEKAGEELIASDKLIQYHAESIVRECAGLPLALITIGKAMSTKKTTTEWEYVASMMRKSKYQSIPGMKKESNFFPILKISYDNLESDTLRQCFLYCSLWGEDVEIPADELIECWMGHGLLDDFDDLNEAYSKGETIIGNLKEACLLEPVDWSKVLRLNPKYDSHVKLHDVIRDLALWITSDCGKNKQGWLVQPNTNLERLPEDCIDSEVINFSLNKIRALDGSPNCHKLRTLILSGNWQLVAISTEFFTKMHCLKYLDLSHAHITTLPDEIGGLIGLEYLNLSWTSLISLPMPLGNLQNLKYLYCQAYLLKDIPYGLIASLTKLQVLDLYGTSFYFLEERYLDELLSLTELKGVGICIKRIALLARLYHVPKQRLHLRGRGLLDFLVYQKNLYPDELINLTWVNISQSLLGSNCKTNLHELKISIITTLQELVITTQGDSSWCLSHLKTLSLVGLPQLRNVIWKDLEACHFLPSLTRLVIDGCDSLTNLCWTAELPCLQILSIMRCTELKSIITAGDESDGDATVTENGNIFNSLKELDLWDNPNLEWICEEELSLPSIERFCLTRCFKLQKLPLGLDSAKNLKIIHVSPESVWENMDWVHKDLFSHLVQVTIAGPLVPIMFF